MDNLHQNENGQICADEIIFRYSQHERGLICAEEANFQLAQHEFRDFCADETTGPNRRRYELRELPE